MAKIELMCLDPYSPLVVDACRENDVKATPNVEDEGKNMERVLLEGSRDSLVNVIRAAFAEDEGDVTTISEAIAD